MQSDSDTPQSDRATPIVPLNPPGWYSRQELARRLGVCARTVERRVYRGLIEKRDGASGKLYREVEGATPKRHSERQRHVADTSTPSKRHQATATVTPQTTPDVAVSKLVEAFGLAHQEIGRLQAMVAHLEGKLAQQEEQAQTTIERLTKERDHLSAELALRPRRRRVTSLD